MADVMKTYDFYSQAELCEYAGEWVVLVKNKVVLHGKSAKGLLKEFREKYPKAVPFIVKVPDRKNHCAEKKTVQVKKIC